MNRRSDGISSAATCAFYSRLLGDAWCSVHPFVKSGHLTDGPLSGEGIFKVSNGGGVLVRVIRSLLRLPKFSSDTHVSVNVTPAEDGELWIRRIGSRMLRTRQRLGDSGLMCESFGWLEFCFKLHVADGAIEYEQIRARIRLALIRIPIPSRIAPQIRAIERAGEMPNQTRVSVQVRLPRGGLLLAYDGRVNWAVPEDER